MDAAEAISLVTEWILWEDRDCPTDGLEAERFEAGWSVCAPAGRPVFLVGDSGRIEEVSTTISLQEAYADFTAEENAAQPADDGSDQQEFIADFELQFRQAIDDTGAGTSNGRPAN